jgi:hypothetical protein
MSSGTAVQAVVCVRAPRRVMQVFRVTQMRGVTRTQNRLHMAHGEKHFRRLTCAPSPTGFVVERSDTAKRQDKVVKVLQCRTGPGASVVALANVWPHFWAPDLHTILKDVANGRVNHPHAHGIRKAQRAAHITKSEKLPNPFDRQRQYAWPSSKRR